MLGSTSYLPRNLRKQGYGATGTARTNSGIHEELVKDKNNDGKVKKLYEFNAVKAILTLDNQVNQIAWKDNKDEPEIRHALIDDARESFAEYKIMPEDVRSNTAAYPRSIVNRKLPNKSDDVRSTLSEAITDRCQGQFLSTRDDAWTSVLLADSYTNPTNRSLPLGTSFMGTNLGSSCNSNVSLMLAVFNVSSTLLAAFAYSSSSPWIPSS
ncbi:hypothetical protein IWW34DRAFT_857726 [Fusarium oxysporum f. sp. albedinis]|nr:hypothetical protein IWW34DRAFT_857726 [Fusarium oxysporum f. sp. albedinis]